MLKRRILASSMASVMAISSVVGSAVAFAADTDVTTQDGLKKYLEEIDKFMDEDLDDYGEDFAIDLENAYEQAMEVAEGKDPSATDCAAAYAMVQSIYESRETKTKEQLQELIKNYQKIYDTENILNDLGDPVYSSATWEPFATAFEDAEYAVEGDDKAEITDAWKQLDKTGKKLDELEMVTKAKFVSTMRKFNTMIESLSKYEDWRRGAVKVAPTTDVECKDKDGNDLDVGGTLLKAKSVTFGQLKDIVLGTSDNTAFAVKDIASSDTGKAKYINYTGTNVREYVETYYNEFVDGVTTVSETTNENILGAYNAANDAIAVFGGWEVDGVRSGSKRQCEDLLKKYHDQLVLTFKASDVSALMNLKVLNGEKEGNADASKLNPDQCVAATSGKIIVDKDNHLKGDIENNAQKETADTSAGDKEITVRKGENILKYIDFKSTDVTAGNGVTANNDKTGWKPANKLNTEKELKDALTFYEAYVAVDDGDYKDAWDKEAAAGAEVGDLTIDKLSTLDQCNTVKTIDGTDNKGGSREEWAIIYRYLNYQLTDSFGSITANEAAGTKSKVSKLINDSYTLLEDTVEVASFSTEHNALNQAVECAHEWLREANATTQYKDGKAVVYRNNAKYCVGASAYIDGGTDGTDASSTGVTAAAAYDFLKGYYDALNNKNKSFALSYGEIRDKIGEVQQAILGDVTPTEDLTKALADCATKLSTFGSNADDVCGTVGMDAWEDYEFQPFSRLLTSKIKITGAEYKPTKAETALKAAYDKLIEEFDAAKKGETLDYDVNDDDTFDPLDAKALLEKWTAGEALDPAKYNFNNDAVVDPLDAKKLLEIWTEQA